MKLTYDLRLLEDVVLPSGLHRGGGQSLTFIPGAVILGAVAKACYDDAEALELAWEVFHSGHVRFGDARLLGPSGQPTIPIPRSLHGRKRVNIEHVGTDVLDFVEAVGDARQPDDQVFKPIKGQYLDQSGKLVAAKTSYQLKTAVNFDTGRAAESQLFRYDAIDAGSHLGFEVAIDEAALGARASDVAELIGDALKRPIRLGRSRSAQYGRAQATRRDVEWMAWPSHTDRSGHRITFVLASDTVFVDPSTGGATSTPAPADLGLPVEATLDWGRCFVRLARWTPFNGKRRRSDVERVAVAAGSVFTWVCETFDREHVRAKLARGVGAFVQEGLGDVLFEPELLGLEAPEEVVGKNSKGELPKDALGRWVGEQHKADKVEAEAWHKADVFFAENNRKLSGISSSQWRHLQQLALRYEFDPKGLPTALSGGTKALFTHGVGKRDWKKHGQTILDWLKTGGSPKAVAIFAKRMANNAQEKREGGGR